LRLPKNTEPMTQHNSSDKKIPTVWQRSLLMQSASWLSSFSLLSGGLVFAQTEGAVDNIVPTTTGSQVPKKLSTEVPSKPHRAAKPETPLTSEFSGRQDNLKRKLRLEVEASKSPNLVIAPKTPVRREKPLAELVTPKTPIKHAQPERSPSNNTPQATKNTPTDYNNSYLDPTNYSARTADKYVAPSSVTLSERSSGCKIALHQGQGLARTLCPSLLLPPQQPVARRTRAPITAEAPSWVKKSQGTQNASVPTVSPEPSPSPQRSVRAWSNPLPGNSVPSNPLPSNPRSDRNSSVSYNPTINPPIIPNRGFEVQQKAPSAGILPPPMAFGNMTPRPSKAEYSDFTLLASNALPTGNLLATADTGIIFPLSVPAPITSLFGWRMHPITGDRRFHSGTDLGAAIGTPVLAAAAGQVTTANYMGGYGLAVVLDHSPTQETLYGHLSEIFVQPGQWVEQGTVIGRVGTTGNSTGPHLHFEVRQMTDQGWVAADPGAQVETTLSQLMQTLQTAQ
jgi:murein DD-endopeptidase MepM/ murein hydrolase activator NlpD